MKDSGYRSKNDSFSLGIIHLGACHALISSYYELHSCEKRFFFGEKSQHSFCVRSIHRCSQCETEIKGDNSHRATGAFDVTPHGARYFHRRRNSSHDYRTFFSLCKGEFLLHSLKSQARLNSEHLFFCFSCSDASTAPRKRANNAGMCRVFFGLSASLWACE